MLHFLHLVIETARSLILLIILFNMGYQSCASLQSFPFAILQLTGHCPFMKSQIGLI